MQGADQPQGRCRVTSRPKPECLSTIRCGPMRQMVDMFLTELSPRFAQEALPSSRLH